MRKLMRYYSAVLVAIVSMISHHVYAYMASDYNVLTDSEINSLNVSSKNIYVKMVGSYGGENVKNPDILYTRDADKEVEVASLTKIMTALVFLEDKMSQENGQWSSDEFLNEEVTIKKEMIDTHWQYSKMWLSEGQKVTVRDLLYGMMLSSGADAADALAIIDSGKIGEFVKKMNQKVAELGLSHTHFSNTYGMGEEDTLVQYSNGYDNSGLTFDAKNYSSARDMGIILERALQNPVFSIIFSTNEYRTSYGAVIVKSADETVLNNKVIKGFKTGTSSSAGNCLASISVIDGLSVIMINMGASLGSDNHFKDATNIYQYIGDNFEVLKPVAYNDVITKLPISLGTDKNNYEVVTEQDILIYGKTGTEFNVSYDGKNKIGWNTKVGSILGDVVVKIGEEEVVRMPVKLTEEIRYVNLLLIFVTGALICGGVCWYIRKVDKRQLVQKHMSELSTRRHRK